MSTYSEQRIRELLPRLLDEDEDVRYEAGTEIVRMGRPVIAHALEWLKDPNPRLREMACYVLGQVGYLEHADSALRVRYPECVPPLVQALKDADETVRPSAAIALGHHADASTIPSLLALVGDSSAEVRHAAAVALGSFFEDHWNQSGEATKLQVQNALLELMDDPDVEVRDWATFGIHQGGHDTPEVRSRLWRALDDPDVDVRGEAAHALAVFGDAGVIPRLEDLLRSEELSPCYFMAAEELGDPSLLSAAEEALVRWEVEMGPDDERSRMLRSLVTALREGSGSPGGSPSQ